jgi:hypothetical protein
MANKGVQEFKEFKEFEEFEELQEFKEGQGARRLVSSKQLGSAAKITG